MTQKNSVHKGDSQAGALDVAAPARRRGRRGRWLSILFVVVIVCTAGLAWWRPWDTRDAPPPPPVTVCDGVYRTAELDRILNSQIGDYWIVHFGPRSSRCTVQSGKAPETDAEGHQRTESLLLVDIPSYYEEYDAGDGVIWSEESMAAAAEGGQDVQKLDTPDLDGSSYIWMRPSDSGTYTYGFWYGDSRLIVVKLFDLENKLDGPRTTQEALDVMPELLTYIVTESQRHDILPTPDPSDTPAPQSTGTGDQAVTDTTVPSAPPGSTHASDLP